MRSSMLKAQGTLAAVKYTGRQVLLALPVALFTGSMVALFLWLLNAAIFYRFAHPWLLYLLPAAGLLIHFIYRSVGKSSEKGNNLVINEIHEPGTGVPPLMAPIILITTVITHLFGGSAGREGTAVQIGGSIAALLGRWFKLNRADTAMLLTAGVAAGFGAVFGTPLTGAIFAIEVLTIGKINYRAVLPALTAAVLGNLTVNAWHVGHVHYHISAVPAHLNLNEATAANLLLLLKVIAAAAAFGLVSRLFAHAVVWVKKGFNRVFTRSWLVPIAGGLVIIALVYINGRPDYLSLGVNAEYAGAVTIPSSFSAGGAQPFSWLWKLIYTAVTLGTGFKGGEVTPLFYIGATLGNTLAQLMDAPTALFAAMGFIAVFAGATNTPLACTIMGAELFGTQYIMFFAAACFIAYFFSGHAGIYSAQRLGVHKVYGHKSEEV